MDKNSKGPGLLRRVGAVFVLVAMSGGMPAAAVGEQSEGRTLVIEEIIVTARKKEESAQDVGAAITAFTGEQVKQLAISNTQDLQTHTPGLMTSEFGSGAGGVFTVRGVGQLDFADHQEQPVAVYADGAYNSFLGGVSFAMYDIERVEVLRGPQATLFGRNATGGVVHVITTKPTREADGYVELRAGEYGEYRGEFGMGGPLGDTLSARFSGTCQRL